jgi:CDGSH-type Zn-finger protein
MDLPKRAGDSPIVVNVEEGKTYAWCSCGLSGNQPFCDGQHSGTEFKPVIYKTEKAETKYFCACKKTSNGPFCDGTHID